MDVELADLRAYLHLVREGSYRRAAPAAHLTPSGLSRAVRRLETAVGERLVWRDAGGIHGLTPAGRQLAEDAEQILAVSLAAVEAARTAARFPPVLVGFPGVAPPAAARTARTLLRELARVDPTVRVRFVEVSFHDMWRSLREERVDVALNTLPCPDDRIVSTPLVPMTRIGLVGQRNALAEAGAVAVQTFAEQRLLRDGSIPESWMAFWVLGDVRNPREGPSTEVRISDMGDALRGLSDGSAALVTQAEYGAVPGPFATVELLGVPPAWHYADRRRNDRRPSVRAVVEALRVALRDDRAMSTAGA